MYVKIINEEKPGKKPSLTMSTTKVLSSPGLNQVGGFFVPPLSVVVQQMIVQTVRYKLLAVYPLKGNHRCV